MPTCYFCGEEIPEGRQICPICENDKIAQLKAENERVRQNNVSANAVKILLDNKDEKIQQLTDALYLMADYYACKTERKDCIGNLGCKNRLTCVQKSVDLFIGRAAEIATSQKCDVASLKTSGAVADIPQRVVAVDFDGTLCEGKFPDIGAPKYDVIQYVKSEQASGSVIILWTCRQGLRLAAALSWCERQGLVFDYVNQNTTANIARYGGDTRKINANVYIDDKAADFNSLIIGGGNLEKR